ncbi:flagellar hook protein FlgE [Delftia sp. PS-11]|uniref:flagellar hook protein FlgE n=1 Tax=Delftia sp. PS-11 TaxID=2767222 RepID=UPI0024583755|nr:flagellar hook protein FlgE [Delftia sp. PS-11]KAJ8746253.1 flagellar hook protein FlgE [Delftia sp. PS-11]
MSFQQALSGLNAASRNLDVIGHNIANSGTTGFKASRTEFSEAMASASGSASGQSVGIGVSVGAVTQQFKQGGITSTGNNLDVAINGNGFFMLRQPDGSSAFTRAGNFNTDKAGNLKTLTGDQVLGYPVDTVTGKAQTGQPPVPMVFSPGQTMAAKTTTEVSVNMNLDARAQVGAGDAAATPPIPATPRATYGTSLNVYDTQGVATPLSLYFVKSATANTWEVYTTLDETVQAPGSPVATIAFDASGNPTPNPLPAINISLDATNNPNNPTPATIDFALDLSKVTQFGTKFAVNDNKQNGYTAGSMTGISISGDGSVVASYSNGVKRTEGQLALASFTNPQGLASTGNNKWVATAESGLAVAGLAQTGTLGTLQAGALEDSNVDLTAELVNMMTAQRAYQSSAQAIKTQDQVFSTLVNLR